MADESATVKGDGATKTFIFSVTPNGATDGKVVWVKDSGGCTLTPAENGETCKFTWEGVTATNTTAFHVEADVDLAADATRMIQETGELTVTFGGGIGGTNPATALNLTAEGAPQISPYPPTPTPQ